jgi:hypothetical protein
MGIDESRALVTGTLGGPGGVSARHLLGIDPVNPGLGGSVRRRRAAQGSRR